jgi:PIN domain nuclease of toxin-antitoxin system
MPEIIILDTHIWTWFINQEFDRFPAPWRIDHLFAQYPELSTTLMALE